MVSLVSSPFTIPKYSQSQSPPSDGLAKSSENNRMTGPRPTQSTVCFFSLRRLCERQARAKPPLLEVALFETGPCLCIRQTFRYRCLHVCFLSRVPQQNIALLSTKLRHLLTALAESAVNGKQTRRPSILSVFLCLCILHRSVLR